MKTGVGNEEQSERSVVAERISVDGRHQSQGVAELTSKRILVLFQLSHSLYATHRRQQTTILTTEIRALVHRYILIQQWRRAALRRHRRRHHQLSFLLRQKNARELQLSTVKAKVKP